MIINQGYSGRGFLYDVSVDYSRGLNIIIGNGNGDFQAYGKAGGYGYGDGKHWGNGKGSSSPIDYKYPFELIQFWYKL